MTARASAPRVVRGVVVGRRRGVIRVRNRLRVRGMRRVGDGIVRSGMRGRAAVIVLLALALAFIRGARVRGVLRPASIRGASVRAVLRPVGRVVLVELRVVESLLE